MCLAFPSRVVINTLAQSPCHARTVAFWSFDFRAPHITFLNQICRDSILNNFNLVISHKVFHIPLVYGIFFLWFYVFWVCSFVLQSGHPSLFWDLASHFLIYPFFWDRLMFPASFGSKPHHYVRFFFLNLCGFSDRTILHFLKSDNSKLFFLNLFWSDISKKKKFY